MADIVVIYMILFFSYFFIFFHILLSMYMLNRDPVM